MVTQHLLVDKKHDQTGRRGGMDWSGTERWQGPSVGKLQQGTCRKPGRRRSGGGDEGLEMLNLQDPSLGGMGRAKERYRERLAGSYPQPQWPFSLSSASSILQMSEDMSLPQWLVVLYPRSIRA